MNKAKLNKVLDSQIWAGGRFLFFIFPTALKNRKVMEETVNKLKLN